MHQFKTKLHTSKFEIENEISQKLDEKLNSYEPQNSAELQQIKSEIYDYL